MKSLLWFLIVTLVGSFILDSYEFKTSLPVVGIVSLIAWVSGMVEGHYVAHRQQNLEKDL